MCPTIIQNLNEEELRAFEKNLWGIEKTCGEYVHVHTFVHMPNGDFWRAYYFGELPTDYFSDGIKS